MNVNPWINVSTKWLGASMSIVLADTAEAEREAAAAGDWGIDEAAAYCPRCGTTRLPGEARGERCVQCSKEKVGWDRVVRLSDYAGPMSRWIPAMKFQGQWGWARWFGRQLAERMDGNEGDQVVVCPVAMHWMRRWQRGFNQAQLMAETVAAARRWPMVSLVNRSRFTPPQTAVPAKLRAGNVAKSFSPACIDLAGWRVWLIDDVKTTGATAHACCRVLREMGASSVNLAVAAVTDAHR